jgi:hypothetical protein
MRGFSSNFMTRKFRAPDLPGRILPIGLSQCVGIVCGIAGVRIVSHLIPPETLGAYGVFLTFTTLGASLVHSGLIKFVGRHWAQSFARRPFVANVGRAWLRKLPWLFFGTLAAGIAMQRAGQGRLLLTFPALFIATIGLSIGAIAQTALQAVRRHWADFLVSASGSLTRTFVPPLLFLVSGGAISGLYLGFCVHALCLAILNILKKTTPRFRLSMQDRFFSCSHRRDGFSLGLTAGSRSPFSAKLWVDFIL